jgi:anaphase-promoting complex subunit 5
MHRAVMDVQYFLSVVYHNLGLQAERDDAAKRHFATLEMRKQVEMSDEGITGVLEVVRMVGATLAHRSDRV